MRALLLKDSYLSLVLAETELRIYTILSLYPFAMCACVRACVRTCVRACVRACVCVCVQILFVCVYVCV